MHAISGQKRVRGQGHLPVNRTTKVSASWAGGSGTAHGPETRNIIEQVYGFSATGSEPAITAAGATATGPAFARAAGW